jgi:hypothetical protein
MRHLIWIAALTVVALAAWWLLDGAPRRGGDVVRAVLAAPVPPGTAESVELREVEDPTPAPVAALDAAPSSDREAVAREVRAIVESPEGDPMGLEESPTGSVSGLLRSESGAWNDLAGLLRGGVVVELFDPADARATRRAELEPVSEPDGSIAIAFRFEAVPPGSYRLGVTSLVAEVWEPASQPIDAPEREIVVWCRDRIGRVRLSFDVRDAETGAPVEGWSVNALRQTVSPDGGVLLQAAQLETEAFPVDGRLDWSVVAPGYAPAFGDERLFVPEGEGSWSARVGLRRGWAARVVALARDPLMRPIEGARIEVDGAFAGLTGARGWLDVALPAEPEALAVSWNGLVTRVAPVPSSDSAEARLRGQILPVVLE